MAVHSVIGWALMPSGRGPLIVALLLLASPRAFAQAPSVNTTAAQALFDDAKALMKAGRYDEACPKLEESQKLDPGGGTLVALGLCYEGQGKLGSAWTVWDLALSDARSSHRTDREAIAAQHVRELEKKLPRIRIVVGSPVTGLDVQRDGASVPAPLWGTAIPTDPGTHRVDARAPGKDTWSTRLEVPSQAVTVDVIVPRLVDAAPPPPAPAPAPAPATAPPPSPAPAPRTAPAAAAPLQTAAPAQTAESSSSSLRTWAFVIGGAGILSAGVGSVFAISASSKWSDAHAACPNVQCGRADVVAEAKDAGTAADVATVLFAVGGVAVASSVVMFLLSPSHAPTSGLSVTPLVGTTNGLAIGGAL